MERVIERCCGLDVHKKTVVAGVRVPGGTGGRDQHVRTFGTTTAELLALRDWLEAYGVTHVAMESTGVYWKPIFYVLEDAFTCVLANAAQIAQVPGRKTDVRDCVWIAQLLEHGLVRGSFVPPVPIRNGMLYVAKRALLTRKGSECLAEPRRLGLRPPAQVLRKEEARAWSYPPRVRGLRDSSPLLREARSRVRNSVARQVSHDPDHPCFCEPGSQMNGSLDQARRVSHRLLALAVDNGRRELAANSMIEQEASILEALEGRLRDEPVVV